MNVPRKADGVVLSMPLPTRAAVAPIGTTPRRETSAYLSSSPLLGVGFTQHVPLPRWTQPLAPPRPAFLLDALKDTSLRSSHMRGCAVNRGCGFTNNMNHRRQMRALFITRRAAKCAPK